MKKKSSIIKLSIIGVVIVLGFVLAFCPMRFGFTDYRSFVGAIKEDKLTVDLKGGVYAVYEGQLKDDANDSYNSAMNAVVTALKSTFEYKNYANVTVKREGIGNTNIRVSVPNTLDPNMVSQIVGTPIEIRFILRGASDRVVLTGEEIESAVPINYQTGEYGVSIVFNQKGADAFYEVTANNTGSNLDIVKVVGGEEITIQRMSITTAVSGGGVTISGMTSFNDAEKLSEEITAGKLSLNLIQLELRTVAPALGQKTMLAGLIATIIGLVLVICLMIWLYGLYGTAGSISFLIYSLLMIFILAVFPWVQLSLAGIIGILLSIALLINGNIIIFEKIKDEYRNGKSILSSTYYGFRKSIKLTIDVNIVAIIASLVLFFFGTGAVKSFAVVLLIGILLNIFTSLVVTRGLINYMVNINQTNANLFRLVRGEEFKDLSAESNSTLIELEEREKEKLKKEKNEGGIA